MVVGIVYKDIHLLLPDESQACLDGYVLINVKDLFTKPNTGELSFFFSHFSTVPKITTFKQTFEFRLALDGI